MADSSPREAERRLRLLRRLDLEEVLTDLGVDILWTKGADGYAECPDPDHVDGNPSFHVCLEEVTNRKGQNRLGWFNCWSHEGGTGVDLRGVNFLDLVARIRGGVWDRWTTDDERRAAAGWLRQKYVRTHQGGAERAARRRIRVIRQVETGELVWPKSKGIAESDPEFRTYLKGRGFPLGRAVRLGVRAVKRSGDVSCLSNTVPALLFPIYSEGEAVNWFARSITRRVESKNKGRYAPGVALGSAGIFWAPERPDFSKAVALTEGLLDAERVKRVVNGHELAVAETNVLAVLGGSIHKVQASRLRACPAVYVLADGDKGGAALLKSVKAQLERFTNVVDASMPAGCDPDDVPAEELISRLKMPKKRVKIAVRYRRRSRSR